MEGDDGKLKWVDDERSAGSREHLGKHLADLEGIWALLRDQV
jgi:hypothetical protein